MLLRLCTPSDAETPLFKKERNEKIYTWGVSVLPNFNYLSTLQPLFDDIAFSGAVHRICRVHSVLSCSKKLEHVKARVSL